jgi:hypothetical protein
MIQSIRPAPLVLAALLGLLAGLTLPTRSFNVHAQQPTGSVPTVTGTPPGAMITVDLSLDQISVYAGPSTYLYPAIGVMLAGQQAPALGRSVDEQWIQIYYPGVPGSTAWVYGLYVSLSRGGSLEILLPPPTPTPASTHAIDPTLEAAFLTPQIPTRLATFTPPAALVFPTFIDPAGQANRLPAGLLIFGFGFVGVLGAFISYLRGR